jgi:hypothetical protein
MRFMYLGVAALAAIALAGCGKAAANPPAQAASHHLRIGRACTASAGSASITLSDSGRAPVGTVRAGSLLVVTVPGWNWGKATTVRVAKPGLLEEECSVQLRDRGRRTIFLATRPGRTELGATVHPASNLMMPAWGGEVTVRAAS